MENAWRWTQGTGCVLEVTWIDVLIDLGEARAGTQVDFRGEQFSMRGQVPRVRAYSGISGDELAERWVCPWGGPFGSAYDREFSMLSAPVVFWRSGEQLLTDVGDEQCWEVKRGELCVRSNRATEYESVCVEGCSVFEKDTRSNTGC
jgi:hypothetical protein